MSEIARAARCLPAGEPTQNDSGWPAWTSEQHDDDQHDEGDRVLVKANHQALHNRSAVPDKVVPVGLERSRRLRSCASMR